MTRQRLILITVCSLLLGILGQAHAIDIVVKDEPGLGYQERRCIEAKGSIAYTPSDATFYLVLTRAECEAYEPISVTGTLTRLPDSEPESDVTFTATTGQCLDITEAQCKVPISLPHPSWEEAWYEVDWRFSWGRGPGFSHSYIPCTSRMVQAFCPGWHMYRIPDPPV